MTMIVSSLCIYASDIWRVNIKDNPFLRRIYTINTMYLSIYHFIDIKNDNCHFQVIWKVKDTFHLSFWSNLKWKICVFTCSKIMIPASYLFLFFQPLSSQVRQELPQVQWSWYCPYWLYFISYSIVHGLYDEESPVWCKKLRDLPNLVIQDTCIHISQTYCT